MNIHSPLIKALASPPAHMTKLKTAKPRSVRADGESRMDLHALFPILLQQWKG